MKRNRPRSKAPSRVKYEQENPVVSCRVPKELYERLWRAKQADGRSFADILKIGLGILEVKAKTEQEARQQGFEEGFGEGYDYAERRYKVTYRCSVCRKVMEVTEEDEKKAIEQYMREQGWGHGECHERRR